MMSNISIMASPPAWTSSDGMLSTPADLPFFSDFTAASTFSHRIGQLSLLIGGGTSSILGSPVVVSVYNSEQYSVHVSWMSCSSVRHFPALYWMVVVLSCFELVSFFHKLVGFVVIFCLLVFVFCFFGWFSLTPWQCS